AVGGDRVIDQVSRADHEGILLGLERLGWKPASRSVIYRSLRSFWTFALGHPELPVDSDPMHGMTAPTVPETTIEFVSDEELRRLLATCAPAGPHVSRGPPLFRDVRDEAIIRLLAGTGARLSEIANLSLGDLDLRVDQSVVSVSGKGRRRRDLPLDALTAAVLRRYVEAERPRHRAASQTDRLWLGLAGPMTPGGVGQMLADRGRRAGIERRVHPHELRHRFIAVALAAGLTEGDVMALSGHRSRSMLDRYGRYTRAQRAHMAFRRASASGAIPQFEGLAQDREMQ
ncbi:MAG: tyrosine-type recombinase/integrase, partial [Candidatus Limnocylindrales bacterium]